MRPSPLLFALGVLQFAAAVVAAFLPAARPVWWLPGLAVAVLAVGDAIPLLFQRSLHVTRTVASLLTVGVTTRIQLEFRGPLPNCRRIEVFDGIPAPITSNELPLRVKLTKLQRSRGILLSYDAVSMQRGRFEFVPAWVETPSPVGLWIRRRRVGSRQEVRIFPDYRRLIGAGFHVGGAPGPAQSGRHLRKRGLGLEFHQLREYRQGDMMRTVDQKASSRFHKLIVREMREEEDQTVLFLLDTGYRMIERDEGVSHFDHAFEAMLSLAYVALHQGDRVGVRTWGPDERWIPPRRSLASFPLLVHRLYDVEAHPEASSPAIVLADTLPRLNRRTLIILLTNFREEDGEGISHLIPILRTRHLFCTVWIRETVAEQLVSRVPTSHDEALETSMARLFLTERERCRRSWESQGVYTIDTLARELRPRLIQRYWDIKTRALL